MSNYLAYDPIIKYWNQIQLGEVTVGFKVRRVCQKLIDDMNDEDSVYEYSPERANHAIEFIEKYCKHSKGSLGGKSFILEL